MLAMRMLLVFLIAAAAVALQSDRAALGATLTVDTTADDSTVNGNCTLREAITASNTDAAVDACTAGSGTDTIAFNISGGGPHTIQPTSALPTITDPVIIDGTTEPDFAGTPIVELDGSGAGGGVIGLTISAGGSTVRGLVINRFGLFGVRLLTGGGNTVAGNYIGTDAAGTSDLGNASVGIVVNSGGNTIGGADAADRNVISGNNASGIEMNGASATGNVVRGNYIGTDVTGAVDLGNSFHGVLFNNSAGGNTIGGAGAGEGNLISGNEVNGVAVTGDSDGNSIQGNLIGTDAAGTGDLGNSGDGVTVSTADNTVGGAAAGARNVISGNDDNGVQISGGASEGGNSVLGNYIGTDLTGAVDLGNTLEGVLINNTPGNDIGGAAAGAGNVISGNDENGIRVTGVDATLNTIEGNYIGVDATGATALGNFAWGVNIGDSADNTIGGTESGAGNVISANDEGITTAGTGTIIQGNYIGTDAAGTAALPNASDGIFLGGDDSVVGGDTAEARNVISGNNADGIHIGAAAGATIQGNYIGTDATGSASLGNAQAGIRFSNASNTVGGTTPGAGNVISGNGSDGLFHGTTAPQSILGNLIGTDATGTADLGNGGNGIRFVNGPSNSTIGGTTGTTPGGPCTGACNVISGNDENGVELFGATTSNNAVVGNYIGADITGTLDLGNSFSGILLNGAANTTIGGTTASARNVISANGSRGVSISGGSTGTSVFGNYVGTDTTGTADLGNDLSGVLISGGSTGNTVGDAAPGAGNVISGNDTGVLINNSSSNVVEGNLIGTDATGTADLGNTSDGVVINNTSTNNVVGGTIAGARNVISGNGVHGVSLDFNTASNQVVQGNYIGTDVSGTAALGNGGNGVLVNGSPDNTIGGTAAGARNVISANGANGVEIGGTAVPNLANNNEVLGNYIGTDATGTADLGNTLSGVKIDRSGNTVGGTAAGAGNVISGNDDNGIELLASGVIILGNFIGTDASGTAALGNSDDGVYIDADNNSIGGSAAGAGNVISGNGSDGAEVAPGEFNTDNTFQGNRIGTDVTGTVDLGNAENGVFFNEAPFNFMGGLTGLTVGGPCTGSCNLISGNDQHGVRISGSGAGGSDIIASYIGTDVTGQAPLGNSLNGVFLDDAGGTVIGGTTLATRNVISANGLAGVRMFGNNATGNLMRGNIVGADADLVLPLGNGTDGVLLNGAPDNDIGAAGSLFNWIWYNASDGVAVSGAGATGNTILGSIHANGALGISNSSGGNTELAPPVVTSAGSASGTACANCAVDVYSDDEDEGRDFHGSVVADGAGNWNFAGPVIGPSITATATDAAGNTSEFSTPLTLSATMVVDSTADTNTADDFLTLREAMLLDKGGTGGNGTTSGLGRALTAGEADNVSGSPGFSSADTVNFDTGVFPSGSPSTITLTALLPIMDVGHTTIDGTNGGGTPAGVIVAGPGVDRCFDIQDSRINAITGLQITGCGEGVRLTSSARENVIGGTGAGEGNVISGNTGPGVLIAGSSIVNRVIGNRIGTTPDGTAADGNGSEGVRIEGGAHHNEIGGEGAGERNIISANGLTGVEIFQASDNLVAGNYLGTDVSGTADLGNTGNGVTMDQAPDNTVTGNLASGNDSHGVSIFDATATGNVVTGNFIGTDVTGTVDLGNAVFGVNIGFGQNNTIGGVTSAARNVISGNGSYGISLNQIATANEILGNFIGTDASGTVALGNDSDGVRISASPDNIVGGTEGTTPGGPCTGACNLISANAANGVQLMLNPATGNQVLGNFIGTDVTGAVALGNGQDGVHINDAPDNVIGGAAPGAGNVISASGQHGIRIRIAGATGNQVLGNYIGTDATGTLDLGNTLDGIQINTALNTVGGASTGAGNVISGNDANGVEIGSAAASGNDLLGNYIGTDASGSAALGNDSVGVFVSDAPATDIGGSSSGAGNLISGNGLHGVAILFGSATGTEVIGNSIGTDVLGVSGIPNGSNGVLLGSGATGSEIGAPGAGDGNTIAFNTSDGVEISGAATTGHAVRGNSIHSNGALGINNVGGGNTELAPPVITAAGSASGTACAGCTVDVYSDDADEGRIYEGAAIADGLGDWSFPGAVIGPNVTATATDAGNTSEFSTPFSACADSDGDGLCDSGDPCPGDTDCDDDGLSDDAEIYTHSTDPKNPDTDGDTFLDGDEGCPLLATPWFTPLGDGDCDGWTTTDEIAIGTAPDDACGTAAWPPDFNDDLAVDILDVNFLRVPVFFSEAPGPPYDARLDLNPDGIIDIFDVNRMRAPIFFASCTP